MYFRLPVSASCSKPKDHRSLPFRAASLFAHTFHKTLRDACSRPCSSFPFSFSRLYLILLLNSCYLTRRTESAKRVGPLSAVAPISPQLSYCIGLAESREFTTTLGHKIAAIDTDVQRSESLKRVSPSKVNLPWGKLVEAIQTSGHWYLNWKPSFLRPLRAIWYPEALTGYSVPFGEVKTYLLLIVAWFFSKRVQKSIGPMIWLFFEP